MEMLKVRLQLTDWFPFLFFCMSFLPPCCPPQYSTPSVFSFSFPVSCLACSYFSSAWSGDWKPPKVRRDCPSQKQPAEQPCKSNWEKTLLKLEQILKKRLGSSSFLPLCFAFHCCCEHAFTRTAPRSVCFGFRVPQTPCHWHHWTSQGSPCLYVWDVPLNIKHLNLYFKLTFYIYILILNCQGVISKLKQL